MPKTSVYVLITYVIFQQTINEMQKQCFKAIIKLNDELEKWLLVQDVMDVLGVVYPQYQLKSSWGVTFPVHVAILKGFY